MPGHDGAVVRKVERLRAAFALPPAYLPIELPPLSEPPNKLPGLQIARAAAALSIAYYHSWHVTMPFPPGTSYPIPLLRDHGWIAVNFFFAVSGFVVCLVAAKPNFRPLQFLVRRAFRLYPLWILTSLVFLVVAVVALGLPERHSPAFFAYSLTLLPTQGLPFYDLGWTLQHELAFYAVAALLLPSFGVLGLSAFLCAAAVAEHAFTLPWYLHQYAGYYPNFLAGIAAFAAQRYLKSFGFWIPFAAGIGLLVLFTELTGPVAYPVALFFLLAGFINIEVDEKSPAQKAGVLLGDASYSIYLIHPLVFYCVYWKLQPPLPPIWSQEFLRFGSLTVVCLLAVASWKSFESPIIGFGNRLIRNSRNLEIESPPKTAE